MLIDLSYPIHTGMGVYPNDPSVAILDASGPKSGKCHISRVDFGTHTGTHIDMPFHFIPGGQTTDVFPLENCMGQGFLVEKEYRSGPLLTLSSDELAGMPEDAVFVLYTHWQERYGTEDFFTEYPALTMEAAGLLLEKGVKAIAMDTPSIDNRYTNGELHKLVLGRGVAVIETLANLDRLAAVQQDRVASCGSGCDFTIYAAPLKLTGGDGSPVRAFALTE